MGRSLPVAAENPRSADLVVAVAVLPLVLLRLPFSRLRVAEVLE
jgi:hypothetical protein